MFKEMISDPGKYRKFYAAIAGLIIYVLTEQGIISQGIITEEQLTTAVVAMIPLLVMLIPNKKEA